ncbi:putative phage tail protein [Paenibacillus aquistagni]|uniref:putative phage tail protein n=1 Tax=Paenibacillus aquistagni TaxID=1852522 RepID=UPI00145B2F25|nr:putative phage tail protein [Paenibacillus aquistagni]NMM52161.1 DUF2313 domain-containing protein [Paenibacillus aquistagni]
MDKITENLHNVMRHDPLTNEMSGAINVSIDDLDARISGFVDQLNVDTASWGLDVYEHELGIPIDHSKPLDQRRSVIKSKLRGSGKVGAAQIKLVADSYSNGDVSVTLDKGIVIEFTSIYGVPDNIEDLKKVLREIAPAHLSLSFIFKYVLYGDIKDKQYSELSAMSYNELVNKGAASNYSLSLNALGTTAHGLPLIDDTMTADVPRDYNALSQAVDTAITEAVSSIEVTPEQIGAVPKDEFDTHVNDMGLHVTAQKQQEWNNKANAVHQHAASDITSGTLAAARLPAATTSAAGIVKLNNTITSTSTTEAATAGAVKQVNDKFSNMIRVNGGKLEYWNGSGWVQVMSGTVKSVQRGVFTASSAWAGNPKITISPVDVNKSTLNINSLAYGGDNSIRAMIGVYLETSTTIAFQVSQDGFTPGPFAWEVIEFY